LVHKAKLFIILVGMIALQSGMPGHVAADFDSTGLTSVSFGGFDYLAVGAVRVRQVTFQPPHQTPADDLVAATHVDAPRHKITQTFTWGTIETTFRSVENRLTARIVVKNGSSDTITGLWLEPLGLRFPGPVREYDGKTPLLIDNIGRPAAIQFNFDAGIVVVAADDLEKPLQIGLPWQFEGKPDSFPLSVNTGRVAAYPGSSPTIRRSIPPKGQDEFTFSVRFGQPGETLESLTADLSEKFRLAYPPVFHWKDHRAIGALFLSTASAGWPKNPRGWLQDKNLDITTPEGLAEFRSHVLQFAETSISILKKMDAQGMITWDVEGQQFPHPSSYVGDPRLLDVTAPEMAPIADEYFKRFRDAGFRVGVCIRPQKAELKDGKLEQSWVDDSLPLLIQKVQYAKQRWGASIFYVDSNVNGDDLHPMDARVFRDLSAAFPDLLFIPEHSTDAYQAYTAPYRELRQNKPETSRAARLLYPDSISVINTADGQLDKFHDSILDGVKHGDILMFRAWFDDPANPKVHAIYQKAK
jgi:hypothetical protein